MDKTRSIKDRDNKGRFEKGRKHTEEWKKQNSIRMKGHIASDETKKKISLGLTGIKRPYAKPPHFTGEKSSHWKGDKVSYYGLHTSNRKTFGKPNKCENSKCIYPKKTQHGFLLKPRRYEWALKQDRKYTRNREDYLQLCTSCHRLYDYGKLTI